MKKILFLLTILLSSCSLMDSNKMDLYEVRMMNGDSLFTNNKPTLDKDNYYRFDDVDNQRYIINKNLVLFVEKAEFKK